MTTNGDSLPSANSMRWIIIGNAENRRVTDFQATAEKLGMSPPECIRWQSVLQNSETTFSTLRTAAGIRIESPGENDQVLHQLIGLSDQTSMPIAGDVASQLGTGFEPLQFGEIRCLDAQFVGFQRALEQLSKLSVPFMNAPSEIAVMFDKWASHQRFAEAGLSQPKTVPVPVSPNAIGVLKAEFGTQSAGRMFLKPRYSSSASGVCAYRWSGDRQQLTAPIELHLSGDSVRLFNSLKIRQYSSSYEIQQILSQLIPQGMIAQQWIPKKQLADGNVDLRILVIAGQARHWVVRQSHHPMTNLHLGNRRADREELRIESGDDLMADCFHLAENAAACFPGSLYAGVDVLIPQKGQPLLCEINAFGDLLPGVVDRGQSAYEAILQSANCATGRSTLVGCSKI